MAITDHTAHEIAVGLADLNAAQNAQQGQHYGDEGQTHGYREEAHQHRFDPVDGGADALLPLPAQLPGDTLQRLRRIAACLLYTSPSPRD